MPFEKKPRSSQVDKDAELKARGLYDPNALNEEGLLNPGVWDGTPNEDMPYAAQSERIIAAVTELFNEHASYGGHYTWRVGLFLEEEAAQRVGEGWMVCQVDKIRNWWTEDMQRRVGLTNREGALCWPGRGFDEKHLVFIYREDKWKLNQALAEKTIEEMIRPPDLTDEERGAKGKTQVKVTNKEVKVPRRAQQ